MVFVDTSALLAVLNADDVDHHRVDEVWTTLLDDREPLRTHSYVIVETTALVQSRQGMEAVRALHHDILPILAVRFPDADLHGRAATALIAAGRRRVSLVDWVSFEMMREERIAEAFALDDDFTEQGFRLRP
jgi:predicted nucleic acid-binding protein